MSLEREIVLLSLGYALLALLLLVALTRTRLPWPVKAAAILVVSAFDIVVFYRTQGLLGWSAVDALPPRFQVLWTETVEPDRATGDPGAVHLWVEALDEANLASGVPRAYRLPFTTALARKADAARDEIKKGHPQAGRALDFGTGEGKATADAEAAAGPGAEPGGDPTTGGFLDTAFLGGDSRSVEFAPLPVPKLPEKGSPAATTP
jgi:hypothetical protein